MSLPRPEYPRPQFVRPEWTNLNGEWEFAFDDGNRGLEERWYDGRRLDSRILVPFPYQSALSGIGDRSIHEVVWYARSFELTGAPGGRDLLLHFGAVDYRTTVWINGQEVGHNRGGHVPFRFDISPYAHAGENRVVVRVEDGQDPRQPRGKQSVTGLAHGIDYYCTTGIWQTVWLEPVPGVRINDIRLMPYAAESAFDVWVLLHAPSTGWEIEVSALDGNDVVATARTHTPRATARVRLQIPNAKLWSPSSPHLYTIRVRLFDASGQLDEVTSYGGLRDVELRDGSFWLNGERIFLVMALDQGYWPEGNLAAPSDEALRADVEWAKQLGFNGVRKHQKVEDPRWLYWCDRLGLLVWGEMANARAWSPEAEEMLVAEWERAVRRDVNHPCVITWVPVNESWGFPGLAAGHPGQYAFLERIVNLTRRLDPFRPVIDNDGWEHSEVTDVVAIHDYSPTAEALRARYTDAIGGGPLPATVWYGDKLVFSRGSRFLGQPVMLTEVGGFLDIPEGPERDRLYDFYATVGSGEELVAKYRDLVEGIASLPFLAGFCYTQLTDVEQEINGLLTYDRRPKFDPELLAALHRSLFNANSRG